MSTEQEKDAEALKEGYTPEEIAAYKAQRTAGTAPPGFGNYVANQGGAATIRNQQDFNNKNNIDLGSLSVPSWVAPAVGTLAAGAAGYGLKKLWDQFNGGQTPPDKIEPTLGNPPPSGRIEPTFDTQPTAQTPVQTQVQTPAEQQNVTLSEAQARLNALKPPPAATAPSPAVPAGGVANADIQPQPAVPQVIQPPPVQPVQPADVAPPTPPAPVEAPPVTPPPVVVSPPVSTITPPTSTNVTKAPPVPDTPLPNMITLPDGTLPPPPEPPATPKTGRPAGSTNAAKQAALQAAAANAPKGMVPVYPTRNKMVSDVLGQGGWMYNYNQWGPEAQARWEEQYGQTNQPYERVRNDISASQMGPYQEGVRPPLANYGRAQYKPEYIKGGADPALLGNIAGNVWGGIQLYKAYQEGQRTGDWSNLGLGAVGQILANLAPRVAGPFALASFHTPMEAGTLPQKVLDAQQAATVGAGRGIAPPSAYKR